MKYPLLILLTLFFFDSGIRAQKENSTIRNGNRLYKKQQMDQAQQQYQKAVQLAPSNPTTNYNLGNAQFRKNDYENAASSYRAAIEHSTDSAVKEMAWYNEGVSTIKQKKLQESIDAWKNALKIDPADNEARENLQKALMEQKKQQQNQKNNQQQNKKQDQQPQQPKQQQSRLNRQQVEQLLKALAQKEKEVQEKMNQNKVKSLSQPDKDW